MLMGTKSGIKNVAVCLTQNANTLILIRIPLCFDGGPMDPSRQELNCFSLRFFHER